MAQSVVAELSDTELIKKKKMLKTNKVVDAFLIGFTIGAVIYGAVTNGFGFFTFFPLVITYVIIRNSKSSALLEKEIDRELQSRKLI